MKPPNKPPKNYKTPIDLSFGYQNIEGIHGPTFMCKLPFIHSKFTHDIEVLSETWGVCNHEKNAPGYKLLCEIPPHKKSNIIKGRASGGILIYCKNSISPFIKKSKKTPQYIWLTINKSIFFNLEKSIKVCVAYNPPENSHYCNKDIFDDISQDLLHRSNSNCPVLIIGDLNSRTGELPDYEDTEEKHTEYTTGRKTFPKPRKNRDKTVNKMGEKLIELCKSHDLQILNGRSVGDPLGSLSFYDSKQGASAIDVAIASDPIVKEVKTFTVNNPVEFSQHCKIELRLKNIIALSCEEADQYPWIELGDKYKWQEDSGDKFQEALNSPTVIKLVNECNQYLDAGLVEPASDKLISIYIEAAKLSLEVKKVHKKTEGKNNFKHKKKWKKWFDQECRDQKNITRKLAIHKHQHPEDSQLRTKHNEELKKYKKLCSRKKYVFEQQQIDRITALADNTNEFWKEWKHFDDTIPLEDSIKNIDGKRWEGYFSKLYDDQTDNINEGTQDNVVSDPNPIDAIYTPEELDTTIAKLKVKKAAGLDRLLTEFIKASPDSMRKLLLRMINTIYSTNIVPKSWCLGIITPIHKEGPKDDPDNYRGICIGSALSKVLSTMMNERLTKYAKDNKMIDKSQIGFTSENRTSDHILTVKSLVNKYVQDKKKGKLYACYIDFRKAFDTVWHQGLFHKLQEANIKGNFLNTLKDMYKKTECAVKFGNKLTQFFKCKKGVRQGDPLSPLLFNIFINGVFDKLRNNNCNPVTFDEENYFSALAYADDIVLFSTTAEGLQKALDTTEQYCKEWRLSINHKKTKCMTFTRGTQKEKTKFTIGGIALENTNEYKYLGIIINKKNCTFIPATKALRIKATRALYAIKAKVHINNIPIRIAMKLFDSLIKPILLYASEAWEPFLNITDEKWDYSEIEKAHLHFIKQILGVNRSTTNILVQGETNRHSLRLDILKRNIRYIKYIKRKNGDCIVKQAMNYEIQREQSPTFMSTIERHQAELQQAHGQFFPYKDPYENILDITEEKLKKYTRQVHDNMWKAKLETSVKGETYRTFKTKMCYEPFLDQLDRKQRRTMLKFRLSDHKLLIEIGRHYRPLWPRENRLCMICGNAVEDEQHMLIDCKLYGQRNTWFSKIGEKIPNFTTLDSHQKFIFLMTQEDCQLTREIAEKITTWMNLRELITSHFF